MKGVSVSSELLIEKTLTLRDAVSTQVADGRTFQEDIGHSPALGGRNQTFWPEGRVKGRL
jgi:hypothetical protein